MKRLFLVLLVLAIATSVSGGPILRKKPTKYNTAAPPLSPNKINVHIVCHTHNDVGWLKTIDQYYLGSNNSIQHAGVQYILDSVVASLRANPDRKFMYVETAFFARWWNEQNDDVQQAVRKLIKDGQLVFVNGGWSMHDEATAHYVDMVDQTTYGHEFLAKEFGAYPRVTWQIDPFGHSSTQASLLSAEAGFDALYFARIDYQDRDVRWANSTMEMLWRASESLGVDAQVFTGVLADGYGPPEGFCFDSFCEDAPINDDDGIYDVNVADRVNKFVSQMEEQAAHYRTNNIMLTMGSDFQYENANEWYKNLDKLIHYTNLDGRINVFYSTPEIYTDAKHAAGVSWSVKYDDFFPYADDEHAYWTGYFTSRAGFKRYVRDTSGYLQTVRHLECAVGGDGSGTETLMAAISVGNHHDGLTGTEKQHVAYDYAERISEGQNKAQEVADAAMSKLMSVSGKSASPMRSCLSLNVSVCAATTYADGNIVVVAYNPLGQSRSEVARVPVSSEGYTVVDDSQAPVESTVLDQHAASIAQLEIGGLLPGEPSKYTVNFEITLAPFSFATFYLKPAAVSAATFSTEANTLENDHVLVTFDSSTGLLASITNKEENVTVELTQSFAWYISMTGHGQNGGAYILRPNSSETTLVAERASLSITGKKGGVQEARQQWSEWVTQTVRLSPNAQHVEFEWTVGPVPVEDKQGKEVITRFTSNIDSKGVMYTDSNGRDALKRIRNFRPTWDLHLSEPVAGNYYPINAFAAISDDKAVMSVLADRSQGAASLKDGEIEILVQRRLLADDARGVDEPLDETLSITHGRSPKRIGPGVVIRGKHYVVISSPKTAALHTRKLQGEIFQPSALFFGTAASTEKHANEHLTSQSILNGPLPQNVALMTYRALGNNEFLVRLSHQFGVNEDEKLSLPATVSIASLFKQKVHHVEELTLTANRPLSELHRLKWQADDGVVQHDAHPRAPVHPAFEIELTPLKIRTFRVTLE